MCTIWQVVVWASVALLADARRPRQSDGGSQDDMMNIKMLGISVPGTPGEDYPIFASVPSTSFSCADKDEGGYYADMEAGCQVYHTCATREDFNFLTFSRLCPNGTIFGQEGQTCRWWYLVDCQSSESFYFSETNVRGSQSSSSSSSSSSLSSSSSSGNFDSVSQFGLPTVNTPPRPSQENSENTLYAPIPESTLREQLAIILANLGQKASGSQGTQGLRTISGSRRTQQSNSGANSGTRRNQTTNRRQNNSNSKPRKTQQKSAAVTGNRTPDRRTQQTENDLTNSVDIDDDSYAFEEKTKLSQPATIPSSKRDLTFRNGRIHLKSG